MLAFDPTDKTLHTIDDDGTDQGEFCEGFYVAKTLSNLVTGEETAIINAFTKSGIKNFAVPADHFTVSLLPGCLLGYGIHLLTDKDTSAVITAYALDSKQQAPVTLTYSQLGWYTIRGKRVYLAHHIIRGEKLFDKSIYAYPEKISPCGTFEAWRKGLTPFLARPEVTLALAIGASAAVVPLLKEAGHFNETPIFALIGKSGTYKTTMLRMQAGIYGKPSIGDGIIDTMMDTTNYFFHQLGKKNGFIHAIDDISAAQGHDFSNDLYLISMGRSKGQLNSECEPRPLETWCTTVVYTGETSIFDQTNKNGGLYARLIEFNFEWLTDADDVNGFYNTINNNYGVALRPLVKTLFKLSKADINELYSESLKMVQAEIPPKDSITRRITERFAILVMTLDICTEAWGLDLTIQPVMKLLVESYNQNYAVIDPITIAIERLKEQILANNSLFLKKSHNASDPQRAWGIYGEYRHLPCLWIGESHMNALAEAAEIQNFQDIRKELADAGFLVRDASNHYLFKKTITSGFTLTCHGVYTNNGTPQPKGKPAKKQKSKSTKKIPGNSPQRKALLADDEKDEVKNGTDPNNLAP